MDTIKKIVSSAWFIPAVSIILISLVIWFAGPYFAFADYYPLSTISNRVIAIIFMLLIYFLVLLLKYHKTMKNQKNMVDEITEDAATDEVIHAESTELKNKFKQAFSLLKNNKAGPSSLTDLPWYMIIGSPGSGKTTLLSNSGLKFPLFNEFSNRAVQGVGGTKNCDWWITQEAVLLDTAGRYASQDSHQKADKSGWNNFLTLIKKYRKKPISGLLISFSMSDLITLSEYELSLQIMQIKQRIAEVNDFFSTNFPIYIIITKSDLIAGFSQFYETFSHKEREQTFGITFEQSDSLSGDLLPKFTQEFKLLMQSITRRQWQRISLERDASRKSLIYGFSEQFASLKSTLDNIIENLSKQDDGLSTGIVRGLYFTSGTQQGAPIDRMIAKVSQAFGLKSTAQALWNNDQRSYFIKELLQLVVFPESDRFGVLAGYEHRKSSVKKIAILAAGVFTLVFCAGLFVSYNNNFRYISLSDSSVDNWSSQYENSHSSGNLKSSLPALNDFSSNISALVEQDNAQFSGLGLAQSNALEGALTASYKRLLKTVLLPFVKKHLEQQIRNSEDASAKYQSLKTYLMLANGDNSNKRDGVFIKIWLSNNINSKSTFSKNELFQVIAHLDNLVDNNMVFETVDTQLVENARASLQSQSLANIYYNQFKSAYVNNVGSMLSMAQLAGSDWRIVLKTNLDDIRTISQLYTPAEFSQVIASGINKYVEDLEEELWILGEGILINKAALTKKIEKSYARDYIKNWQALLNSISIKQSTNMNELHSAFTLIASIDSPLFLLLDSISNATKLVEKSSSSPLANLSIKSNSVNKAKQLIPLRNNDTPDYFITSQFSLLHDYMKEERKTATQQKLATIISEISVALTFENNSGQATSNQDILKPLEVFAFVQVKPVNQWFKQFLANLKNIKNQKQHLNLSKIWQEEILAQCNDAISFKYPFVQNAKNDASLQDLQQILASNGAVYSFFIEHIKPLIKSNSRPWQWKDNIKNTYGFSKSVLPFFEKIEKIRNSLYVSGGVQAQLNLALKPVFLDSRLAKFKMSLYGQKLTYQFGRPTVTNITWPPESSSLNSQFNFVRRDGSEVIESSNGLFALFRLLDNSDINQINKNKVEVTFTKNNYKAIYEFTGKGKINPVVFSNLSNFKCLSTL